MKTFSNNPRFQFRRPVSVASARIDNIQPPDKSIATIYHQILLLLLKTLLAETSLTQNALNQWDRDGAYNNAEQIPLAEAGTPRISSGAAAFLRIMGCCG